MSFSSRVFFYILLVLVGVNSNATISYCFAWDLNPVVVSSGTNET